MRRSINLVHHKTMSITGKIVEYIKPKYVYIPLGNKSGAEYKHLVKEGDYVYKGSVIAERLDINFPIHSSVSGYVIQGTKMIMLNGEKIRCIVVENDFKEKYEVRKGAKRNINDYTKADFIELLRNSGITGLGGSDFPTFLKYQGDQKINCLVVNGVECEPYITSDYMIMKEYSEEILECIDAILEIMKIEKAVIAIKGINSKVIKEFEKYIGTYPNISLFEAEDTYPTGWERKLVRNALNVEYHKYPIEKGIIVNNVSTIFAIYEMLKYNRPLTERVITITGDKIKQPQNVRVKIGALMSEIISEIGGYKEEDLKESLFIAGGPMMGHSIPTDDLVVTKDLNCVIVTDNKITKPLACTHCGKCSAICPVMIIPVLIKDYLKDEKMLQKLNPERCIECGLCSYICPSKIEVREFVREAKLIKAGDKNGI